MSKFIVKVGDETHEVDRDAIEVPDGHVLMTQKQFDSTIDKKYAQAKQENEEVEAAVKAELASDEKFFRQLAEKRGVQLGDDLKPIAKIDPEKIRQLKDQWTEEELAPVQKERDSFKEEAASLRRDGLIASITATAAKMHPEKGVLENPLRPDKPSAFVRDIADDAIWDKETGRHYWKDPKTGSPILSDDGTYAGPDKVLDRIRKADTDHIYFKDVRPGSSDYGDPGKGDGKRVSRSQFEEMNPGQQSKYIESGGKVFDPA